MKLAPGVSNKNVMKLMDAHPLVLIMLILVFFFFIKYLFFKLKILYINSALFAAVIIDPHSAISDAVLTAAATGVIIFIIRDKLKTWIEGNNITTTSHFIDIEDCLRLLTDQIGTYKNKINRAHITTVAPLLFTPEYIIT
jgi:hypothetical protein